MTLQEFAKIQRDYLIRVEKQSALSLIIEFENLRENISDYLTTNLNSAAISTIDERTFLEKTLEEINAKIELIRNPFTRIISHGQERVISFASNSLRKFLDLKTSIFSPDREAVKKLIGRTQDENSSLAKSFSKLKSDVAEKAKLELIEGFEKGESHTSIAARLNKATDLGRWRSLTISRTETNEAYRAASREFYDEGNIKKYIWMAVLDPRTCLICWHLHGRIFKSKIKVFSHPNCRCVLIPYQGQKVKTGAEIFANLETGVQKDILGPARFELFKDGTKLKDFVRNVTNDGVISNSVKQLQRV